MRTNSFSTMSKAAGGWISVHRDACIAVAFTIAGLIFIHQALDAFTQGGDEAGLVQDIKSRERAMFHNEKANEHQIKGRIRHVFDSYASAIELDPGEPVFYQNLATAIFLYRKDAREHYGLSEQQVFDKALELYEKARALDPRNFDLAEDVARTYYGIKPARWEPAMKAWEKAFRAAANEDQRQEVLLHFARIHIETGNHEKAMECLNLVHLEQHLDRKQILVRHWERRSKDEERKGAIAAARENEAAKETDAQNPETDAFRQLVMESGISLDQAARFVKLFASAGSAPSMEK